MGNANANYNNTYNAWLQYRSNLRTSTVSSQTNTVKLVSATTPRNSQINVTPNMRPGSNIPQFKQTVSVISNHFQQKKINQMPGLVGAKIPPVPKQNQQGEIKRSSVVQINPQMTKTELFEQKVMSTPVLPQGQSKVLLNSGQNSKQRKIKFSSKIDLIDSFKKEVKATRGRIDTFAGAQENEYLWILSQIQNEKMHLIPDRSKLIYLLKQAKDYEMLIVGLRTKRQEVVRILNELNQQNFKDTFKQSILEANKYIDSIQEQFVKIDWKAIIMEASTNMQRYMDVVNQGTADPVVQYSLVLIDKEVDALRPPPPPKVQAPISQPQPTKNLPENDLKSSKISSKDQITSQLKSSQLKSIDDIIGLTQEEEANLRSSQQLVSNIQRSSIRMSDLQQALQMNQFGLVVNSPQQMKAVNNANQKVKSAITNSSKSILKQQTQNTKTKKQLSISLSELKPSTQQLAEIKNMKSVDNLKQADIKPIKPVVNAFQSTVRPPPTYNAFSMPKNLLQ